jgi:hypothetical protein
MAAYSGNNIKERKRRLIIERIDSDPIARRGMAVTKATLLILLLLRLILFVFELVYFNASGIKVGIVSNLLLLPMLMIVYMIYDGNKGISGILLIAAVVRVIYLFASVYPTLPVDNGANVYVGVYLFVMAYQFAVTLLMTVYAPSVLYFCKMQAINMELGTELRSGGVQSRTSPSQKKSGHNKKKKR